MKGIFYLFCGFLLIVGPETNQYTVWILFMVQSYVTALVDHPFLNTETKCHQVKGSVIRCSGST